LVFETNFGISMRRTLKSRNYKIAELQKSSGYILITLMLFITLIAMAALAVLPQIAQQVQRDREEELLHRGTEYMRAVKKYYKKFGRYPSRVEELENTNQVRFLRKRFKDPMTRDPKQNGEQEFKFVRMGDPLLSSLGISNPQLGQPGIGQGPGQQGAPGIGQTFGQGGGPQMVGAPGGGVRPAGPGDANTPQVTGLPGQQNTGTQNTDSTANAGTAGDAKPDASSSSSSSSESGPGGQVFGGGPILGVASSSKAKTIREFNKKNHYNEWVFVYDPRSDRGGLLKGPLQTNTGMGGGLDANGGGIGAGAPAQQPSGNQKVPAPAPPPGQQEPPDEQ
jgi:type II secretory pathway pseudopilin PulG